MALVVALIKRKSSLSREQDKYLEDLYNWHAPDMPGRPGYKIWYDRHEDLAAMMDSLNNAMESIRRHQARIADHHHDLMKIVLSFTDRLEKQDG